MNGDGLSYRTRRRLSLLALVVGLPLYIVAAIALVAQFERPNVLVELLIYVTLGVIWSLPLRSVFRGVGRADPDAPGGPDLGGPRAGE